MTTPEQADRDAAFGLARIMEPRSTGWHHEILNGHVDDHAYVQAFALHRERATAELRAERDALVGALGHAVAIINAHVDKDALGFGGDPETGKWPLLDEYLHHMNAALAKAQPIEYSDHTEVIAE